jgi:hypothetical protein
LVVLTSLAWVLMAGALSWVLVAVGWWSLANLWLRELLVPHAVRSTAVVFALVLAWSLVVAGLTAAWADHNLRRYHRRERRRVLEVEAARGRPAPTWPWKEAVWTRPEDRVARGQPAGPQGR